MSPRRHDLPREFIEAHRRRRLIETVAGLACEEGLRTLTVERICRRAKMGRNTFYGVFPTLASCLEASFRATFETVIAPVRGAAVDAPPSGRIEAVTACFYATAAAEQGSAALCLVRCFEAPELAQGNDFWAAAEALAGLLGEPSTRVDLEANLIVARAAASLRRGDEYLLPAEARSIAALIRSGRSPGFGCDDVRMAAM